MEWCVCKYKKTGELFIADEFFREKCILYLLQMKMVTPAELLKTFDDIEEAERYISELESVDSLLDKVLNE
jgi:hypothetical protein